MNLRVRARVSLVAMSLALALCTVRARSVDDTSAQIVARTALQDLRGVDELKTTFNRDTGRVRLVLLLSPT